MARHATPRPPIGGRHVKMLFLVRHHQATQSRVKKQAEPVEIAIPVGKVGIEGEHPHEHKLTLTYITSSEKLYMLKSYIC